MRGATGRAWAALLAGAWLAVACVGPVRKVGDGYRDREHDYWIAAPDGPGPAWERIEVEGAALAFRRPGPETISVQSRCGRPVTGPQLMARHLMIGISQRQLLASGPVQVDGIDAWSQTFETLSGGAVVRVKTVTLVAKGCTFDFALAAAGPFEPAEAAFDAWWGSARLDPRYHEEAER